MSLQSDTELARRDRVISALDVVLDPEEMAAILAPHLSAGRVRPELTKRYVRYKPGMNCLVSYSGRLGDHQFEGYAKAHGDDAGIKLRNARKRKSVAGPLGPGRLAIEDAGLVFSFFPNDSKLRQLPDVMAARWDHILEGRVAASALRGPIRLTSLAYKPERRFVARVDGPAGPLAVLKVYKASSYSTALHKAHFAASLPYLPQLLHQQDDLFTLVLGWTPGRTLSEVMRSGGEAFDHVAGAGRRLAALHASPPASGLAERTAASEAGVLRALLDGVRWLLPAAGDLVARLGGRVEASLRRMPPERVLVHGDFYANQVLLAHDGVRILDSDELSLGHPATDLGLFIAHLEREVFCGRLSARDADALAAALLDGYAAGGGTAAAAAVRIYTVFGMLQLAHRPFRDGEAAWPIRTREWLERCEAIVGHLAAVNRPAPKPVPQGETGPAAAPVDVVKDPGMPFLAAALDIRRSGPDLVAAMAGHFKAGETAVRSARLIRHRPGRRALVEYEVVPRGRVDPVRVIGKIRARGPDERTYQLMRSLHGTGFRRFGKYSAGVPAPLGIVPGLGMWLQARMPGADTWEGLAGPGGKTLSRGIAEALFALHTKPVETDRRHGMTEELAILEAALTRAADVHPAWASRIGRAAEHCREAASKVTTHRVNGIHRDFYPDQVLVHGERIHLIDFDLFCLGDPALDVGNFVAHLQERSLREHGDPLRDEPVQQAFVGRYMELSGVPAIADAIEVYRLLTLARHIFISSRIPERAGHTGDILTYCESQLG